MKKSIILGVTGSIAAVKSVELARMFQKNGWDVTVYLTENALEFIRPPAFSSFGMTVYEGTFAGYGEEREIRHISPLAGASAFIIAPSTANIIAKAACGIADDLLSTSFLAAHSMPRFIAPAMNVEMYSNPVTAENINRLKTKGCRFIGPESGPLACGVTDKGRMSSPKAIYEAVTAALAENLPLKGKKAIVTSGATREYIDSVRFLSNRSSGKMGAAVAEALSARGADVIYIHGDVSAPIPPCAKAVKALTADDMLREIRNNLDGAVYLFMAAAVMDFRPASIHAGKLKKEKGIPDLKLTENTDILMELSKLKNKPVMVGFAAEDENLEENAGKKLLNKKLDFIILNDIKRNDIAFESDFNEVRVIPRKGKGLLVEKAEKLEVAGKIIDFILGDSLK